MNAFSTISTDPSSVFDNTPIEHRARLTLECDPTTLMRTLELFALRGIVPTSIRFDAHARHDTPAVLRLAVVLGRHDWAVLCARAATLVGVLEVADDGSDGAYLREEAGQA